MCHCPAEIKIHSLCVDAPLFGGPRDSHVVYVAVMCMPGEG